MWITLLWQNKGLVAVAVAIAAFTGLVIALKVQTARISSLKEKVEVTQLQRDEAIKQHDALVNDWNRQQQILDEREALRKQQEAENAKLHQTIKQILQGHQAWASARVPSPVVGVLSALPETAGAAGPPAAADSDPEVRRPDQ